MHKVILFISSYIPLYILLIAKNILERCTQGGRFLNFKEKWNKAIWFDEVNDWAVCVLAVMSLFSFFYLKNKLNNTKSEKCYLVKSVRDETSNNYFSYISIYLLTCIGLSLNKIVDIFVLVFLMGLVGCIYVANDLIYLNPTLNIIGYKAYYAELLAEATEENVEGIVICRKNVIMKPENRISGTGKYKIIVSDKNWDY